MALKNLKHEHFAQAFMSGTTQVEAYKSAYPQVAYDTAKVNGCKLLTTREDVRKRCMEILSNTEGLTLANNLEKLKNLTIAEKTVAVNGILESVGDNPTRLESVKTVLKLYGLLTTNSNTSNVDNRSVVFHITSGDIDKLGGITERLEKLAQRSKISGRR